MNTKRFNFARPVLLPTDGVFPLRLVTGPLALDIIIHIPRHQQSYLFLISTVDSLDLYVPLNLRPLVKPGLSELDPLGKFLLTDNPICILVNPVLNSVFQDF